MSISTIIQSSRPHTINSCHYGLHIPMMNCRSASMTLSVSGNKKISTGPLGPIDALNLVILPYFSTKSIPISLSPLDRHLSSYTCTQSINFSQFTSSSPNQTNTKITSFHERAFLRGFLLNRHAQSRGC
jgi:hypothetical protein